MKENPSLNIYVSDKEKFKSPVIYFSSAQINVVSLCIFFARALQETNENEVDTIFLDDPIQNMDSINILSFIDLLRILISRNVNQQIIISTHDENLFNLIKMKLNAKYYPTKFFELEKFGVLSTE